jgi:hypothetical protein
VRPGKPIFKAAFNKMLADKNLSLTMKMESLKQSLAAEEKSLGSKEMELQQLATTLSNLRSYGLFSFVWNMQSSVYRSVSERCNILAKDIHSSTSRIQTMKKEIGNIKKEILTG